MADSKRQGGSGGYKRRECLLRTPPELTRLALLVGEQEQHPTNDWSHCPQILAPPAVPGTLQFKFSGKRSIHNYTILYTGARWCVVCAPEFTNGGNLGAISGLS